LEDNLSRLAAKARHGDLEAFGKLVEHYQNRIFALCYGIVGNREDADDIAQETFIRAYQSLGTLRAEAAFYTWLAKIAVNSSLNYKKKAQSAWTVPFDAAGEPVYEGETPESHAESQADREWLEAVLAGLPPESRAVLVLREIEGLPYEEIAAMLKIPLGTVKSRLNHARGRLRQAVKRKGEIN